MDKKDIEDIYNLSPLQEGLLFHALTAPRAGLYLSQSVHTLKGVDAELLRRAWQLLASRHAVLRTAFVWERLNRPVQVVKRSVEVPWEEFDWRALATSEQEARLARLLEDDRRRGFDLTRAPLMRLTLARVAPDRHRLVWTSHHILLDGWSVPLLVSEVSDIYAALVAGREPSPSRARPYRDYIAHLARQDAEAAESYWGERLRGAQVCNPFSNGARARAGVEAQAARAEESRAESGVEASGAETLARFDTARARLSAAETAALRDAARVMRVTVGTMVSGAWAVLLAGLAGREDVLYGVTVSGRPASLAGVERMVGLFVNTLATRVRVRWDEGVGAWLRELQDEAARARQYEYVPLSRAGAWADAGGAELFDSVVVYENYPVREGLKDDAARQLGVEESDATALTHYAVTVVASARAELEVEVTERAGAARWAGGAEELARRVCGVLRAMTAAATADARAASGEKARRVWQLAEAGGEELRRLLGDGSGGQAVYPRECAHRLFEKQAARTPDAVALISGDELITYAELDLRAERLARRLRLKGVGLESRVGICLGRSAEMVVSLLGVMKAGGAYVPLDPEYPEERLSYMLEDSGVSVVVTRSEFAGRLAAWAEAGRAAGARRFVRLDEDDDPAARRSDSAEEHAEPSVRNLAYVIYTSGSTGRPKGVMVEHAGLPNLAFTHVKAFGLTPETRLLQFASPSFDASVADIWPALLSGAALVVPRATHKAAQGDGSPSTAGAGLGVLEEGLAAGADVMTIPPALLSALGARAEELLAGVKTLAVAGEACPAALAAEWSARVGRFLNAYGPTEATVCSTIWEARGEGQGDGVGAVRATAPIGRPLKNTRAYVVDAWGVLAAAGVVGELYLGGAQLARGYLNRPSLTAERFVPDPFSGEPGARLYRTGDMVRRLAGGELEFVGRRDGQVKVRGFRIELGEVEAALRLSPSVKEATVLAREDEPGDKRLVAYVVGDEEGRAPSATVLREHLRGRLPEYMIPTAFVVLDSLPLNSNGKVDRRALPAPEASRQESESAHAEPRTPVEAMLAGLWREVLKVERVGVNDNFFDLGGHSLLATQVVSRVREAFKAELPLRSLFESPTLAGLAERVEAALRAGGGAEAAPPVSRRESGGAVPASYAQQRLWFLEMLEPGAGAYNVPAAVRLSGALDVGALSRTLDEIVRRHEILRTTFASEGGEPVQLVHPPAPVELPVIDLTHLPEGGRDHAARELAREEARRPFDLSAGPLMRATLLRLGEEDHVALFTMHHVVCDGWSVGILVREVAALYSAYADGSESPLEELPVQYADFAVWQRGWLQGEVLDRQLDYWREQLGGEPPVLELPTDRPRPAVQSYRGATASAELPEELSKQLRALARREGVTAFMLMLAGFEALLRAYTGQGDISVGTPVAGRTRLETEGLIGVFINTLVLRVRHEDDPSFRELLRRVKDVMLEAYAHQDAPFERLVEELQPERSLSRTPLFQVMFSLEMAQAQPLELKGLTIRPVPPDESTAQFDLSMTVNERASGFRCSLEYNTDLFDDATGERMLTHFTRLLAAAVAEPAARVSRLPLLSDAEREQVVRGWNQTRADFPDAPVPRLFEAHVAATPDAAALVFGAQQLTYRELNARANQLARRLRRLGVGPESLVGLCVERSVEMVVGMLGVMKAGGAYVPLDPDYPAARLSFMLEDSGVSIVLTQQRLVPRLAESGAALVRLDADWAAISSESAEDPAFDVRPENVAYVIYTSGSTGRPKGVAIEHRALSNFMHAIAPVYGFVAGERVLQFASISFDVSVEEIYPCLTGGATLVLRDDVMLGSASAFMRRVEEFGLTAINLPTAYWHELVAGMERESLSPPASLRVQIVGGERAAPERVAAWFRRTGVRLLNTYGPTETTVTITSDELKAEDWGEDWSERRREVSIGRPVANTRALVLDRNLRPVPVGVVGELCLGGAQLARGYLGRPALTAERFVPDPFSAEPGARLYRTGDLSRFLPDGRIEYAGRADEQIKIRGYRIELGEIEAAIRAQDGVAEALVVARDDGAGGKRLVAYVVPADGARGLDIAELRAQLRAGLPEYMTPSAFVTLDALPLTPSGKLDRKALPAPGFDRPEIDDEYVAPRTPDEETLCDIWREVLRVERVGVTDNFFELGGHSLLATQIVSRVREALRTELPLRSLFESPTVEGLAQALGKASARGADLEAGPKARPGARDRLPLSYAQQRLWFIDQIEPGLAAYNIPTAVSLRGRLDVPALERAFDEVIRRHEVLRTSFPTVKGEPTLRVREALGLEWQSYDLSGVPLGEREEAARRLVTGQARLPFDLSEGPLLRAALARLGEEEHVLIFTLHHIIADGWSLEVLVRELAALYEAFTRGEPSPLEELPLQYADFAAWQREWLQGEVLERQLDYWRRQLAGPLVASEVPTDYPRPEGQSFEGASVKVEVPRVRAEALRELARREGATLFMVQLAAFDVLLQHHTGREEVVVGGAVANRNRGETEDLIGFFVNTLVLRTDASGARTFREFLRRVRDVTLEAYEHQDVPFERLVEELRPERSLSRTPFFQVKVVHQNTTARSFELSSLTLEPFPAEAQTSKFDLLLYLTESGSDCVLEYSTALYDAATARGLLADFDALLAAIAADPDVELVALRALAAESARERRAREAQGRKESRRQRLTLTRRARGLAAASNEAQGYKD